MNSKLDFLKKKYQGINSGDVHKKRLLKLLQKGEGPLAQAKKLMRDEDELILVQGGNQSKRLPTVSVKEIGSAVRPRGFVQMDEDFNEVGKGSEEEDDIQPVVVGDDFGFSALPQAEKLRFLNMTKQGKAPNSQKLRSRSSSSDAGNRKKRRRHDSDASSDEEVIDTSSRRVPMVDEDGDLNFSYDGQKPEALVEKSGLLTGAELKEFNSKQQELQNKKLMEQIMKDGNTQNQTVYRNASGVVVDMKDKLLSEKDKLRIANEQQLKQWKGGAKQAADSRDLKKAIEEAKTAPFARYEMDPETEKELKNKARFGDPLKLIKSNTMKSNFNQQTYRVLTTQSGYRYLLPKCKFPTPQTRFGIEAGHRWDGVDRGNGYERIWVEKEHAQKDNQEYFRKWAAEDM